MRLFLVSKIKKIRVRMNHTITNNQTQLHRVNYFDFYCIVPTQYLYHFTVFVTCDVSFCLETFLAGAVMSLFVFHEIPCHPVINRILLLVIFQLSLRIGQLGVESTPPHFRMIRILSKLSKTGKQCNAI